MYAIASGRRLINRPVCADCNSYMRLVREGPCHDAEKEHVVYACTGCDRILRHIVSPFDGVAFVSSI